MKGLKAAAFVSLNNDHHHHALHHMINDHHGRSCFNNISLQAGKRRRQHLSLPLQSTIDDNNNNNSEDEPNTNGIFLDLDTYLQAEETLLRPDGSLTTSQVPNQSFQNNNNNNEAYQSALMQGLFPPTYSYPDTKEEQELSDEELLLQSVTNIQNNKSTLTQQQQQMDAETLHQQVFAEEQVYLEQSEEFRKSLSNNLIIMSDDDSYETPMARGRREAIEEYNQAILDDLLRDIEEMEAGAVSREDALARAQTSDGLVVNNDDATDDIPLAAETPAFCSQCGLKVTPDMTQRAKYGPQKLLCQACYGMKFRIKDEADVRLAPGPSVWESNRKFDEKRKSNFRKVRMNKSRMNRGSVLDTSSLFRIPDSRIPNEQMLTDDDNTETATMREVEIPARAEDSTEVKTFSSDNRAAPTENKPTFTEPTRTRSKESNVQKGSTSKVSMKQERRPTSSRLLGGRELERRKTQQRTDDDGTNLQGSTGNNNMEKQQEEDKIIEEEAAFANEPSNEWTKVEDPTTKRIMYWNKATGEMKRNIG